MPRQVSVHVGFLEGGGGASVEPRRMRSSFNALLNKGPEENFLITTVVLLSLSVYMGVAFKDIAVIKMIKGISPIQKLSVVRHLLMPLHAIAGPCHRVLGATLGVSIMPPDRICQASSTLPLFRVQSKDDPNPGNASEPLHC